VAIAESLNGMPEKKYDNYIKKNSKLVLR